MHVRTVGRWAAALAVAAASVITVPQAAAMSSATAAPHDATVVSSTAGFPQAGASTTGSPQTGPAALASRYLSTPPPDPKPPVDPQRFSTYFQAPDPVVDGVPERIAGANRYATAAQIAQQFGTANAVIVANGSNAKRGFDALAANYLAGRFSAPIVLTAGATLEPETAAAVQAALAGSTTPQIFVMGKEDSVSATAADALNAIATTIAGTDGTYVQRVAGDSRYATAADVTTAAGAPPSVIGFGARAALPTAILASGTSNADALAAGPLSNAWGVPVLLTTAKTLPAEIAASITNLGIKQLIVLGGVDRVSDVVVAQAQAAGAGRIQRIAGANRSATSAALYKMARTTFVGPDGAHYASGTRAFLANGITGFPDALAVGPLAAKLGAPLMTVGANDADPTVLAYLDSAKQTLGAITVLGQTATVGHIPLITAKSAIGINILAGSDGTVPPAEDSDAKFQAAAAKLTTFEGKLELAKSYLPNKGAAIGKLYPYMLPGWDAAGLTEFVSCDVWMDNTLPDDQLLDIFRHEYIHAVQCRAENKGFDPGYDLTSDTVINGVERGADAGAYLLGNNYMYYVQFGPTAGPLRSDEIATAQRLLSFYKIKYHIG